MKKPLFRLRDTLLIVTVFGALGIGVMQAFAGSPQVVNDLSTCNTWACRDECPEFGGTLVPGGPGKPLRCACCG